MIFISAFETFLASSIRLFQSHAEYRIEAEDLLLALNFVDHHGD